MKKFILYIILVLGITQLNLSCTPESKIPFLGRMHIVADSLLDIPFPDSLNFENRGIELSKEQYYALTSDSIEGKRIVAIKQYNDNFLVFFCQNRWISTILFDKDGKLLDVCDFFGVIPRKKVSIEVDIDIPIDSFCVDESLWNIKFQDDNNIELEAVLNRIDTIKMSYSISDRITKTRRIASKEIATPALDIRTFAVSQVDSVCERLSVYHPMSPSGMCIKWTWGGHLGAQYLLPCIKYNPQGILQWIYDYKNERVEKCLYYCHETYHRYSWGFSLDFLRENILKLKDKKAQEYLLNMKVFKENTELQK